jgi:hypothetical protein
MNILQDSDELVENRHLWISVLVVATCLFAGIIGWIVYLIAQIV